MKVLELNKIKNDIFEAIVVANLGEWMHKNEVAIIQNNRYIIQKSICKDFDITPRVYTLTLSYRPTKTKYNYDTLNFMNVDKIERSELTVINIHTPSLIREISFDSPEECLNELLQLKRIQRETLSNG